MKKNILGTYSHMRFIISVVLIYLIISVFVYYYAEQLIFPYHDNSYGHGLSGLNFIQASDGTKIATRLWSEQENKAVVVYFHGNYLDLGHLDEVAMQFNNLGYSFLSMDYRGYGLSQGNATETNVNEDAQLLYLKAIELGYEPQHIIVVGRSVGTGVATELATHNNTKALVLISPFVSAFRVMTNIQLFPFDRFDNLSKINQVNTPLMIVHGNNDQVIKLWHGKKLYDSFNGTKQLVLIKGAGHNDVWDTENYQLIQELQSFLQKQ